MVLLLAESLSVSIPLTLAVLCCVAHSALYLGPQPVHDVHWSVAPTTVLMSDAIGTSQQSVWPASVVERVGVARALRMAAAVSARGTGVRFPLFFFFSLDPEMSGEDGKDCGEGRGSARAGEAMAA